MGETAAFELFHKEDYCWKGGVGVAVLWNRCRLRSYISISNRKGLGAQHSGSSSSSGASRSTSSTPMPSRSGVRAFLFRGCPVVWTGLRLTKLTATVPARLPHPPRAVPHSRDALRRPVTLLALCSLLTHRASAPPVTYRVLVRANTYE